MRPVKKWRVGQTNPPFNETVLANYNPHGDSTPLLILNLGTYCSYCEVYCSEPEVEHIVSKHQDITKRTVWDNFLLSCRRCNGRDNKGTKPVNLENIYLPHTANTLLIFEYLEGGIVRIHPRLVNQNQIDKANAILDLVCLDKYPGNEKYPPSRRRKWGFPINDNRWRNRRAEWETAQQKLDQYVNSERNVADANAIAEYAERRGFFSVWFTVFHEYEDVRRALVERYKGTDRSSFDNHFNPIPRNPTNTIDPI